MKGGKESTAEHAVCLYCIRGTFIGDFNFAVWQIWLQLPNLMSANTDYSQTIPFMSVFINPIHQTM